MAAIPPNPPGPGGAGGGGAGAPPPNPNPNPPGAFARIGGALSGIFSSVGAWTADEAGKRWSRLILLLKITILVPVMLFIVGEAVGRFGVWIDSAWMVTAAKGTFAFGSVIGALLTTWLWTKIMIYGHGGALASEGIASLHERLSPFITTAKVDSFLVWLRGWTAWYVGALLILTYVPVYRSLIAAATLVAGLLLMAAIMSSNWSRSNWPRRIMSLFAIGIIVGQIMYLVAPEAHAAVNSWNESQIARLTSWANTESRIATVDAAAEEQEALDDSQRLELNHGRMAELRQKSNDQNCAGGFCTPEDRAEYRRLQRENETIRNKTLRDPPSATSGNNRPSPSKAPAAQSPAPVKRLRSGRLPPPPQVSRSRSSASSPRRRSAAHRPAAVTPTKRKRGPSDLPQATHSEIDSIFAPIH